MLHKQGEWGSIPEYMKNVSRTGLAHGSMRLAGLPRLSPCLSNAPRAPTDGGYVRFDTAVILHLVRTKHGGADEGMMSFMLEVVIS